jgi:hypothetical protein
MTNQTPDRDVGKVVKNNSNAIQKSISTKYLAGAVLVLLAAVGIGMVIREFRFRSYGQKHQAQAPKAIQPRNISETKRTPNEPEIQKIQEQLPIEEVLVEPKSPVPESVNPLPTSIVDTNGQGNTNPQVQMTAAQFDDERRSDDLLVEEQRGRVALGLIGHNPEADEVWIQIINDPSLSAGARQNLIEDLNEDGLSDPRNPTLDDLPVIKYRIQLIEELEPYAMDEVNSDAFQEAHKDLVNMANLVARQIGSL